MGSLGEWFSQWTRSPGFGGLAAVAAAVIAYRAAGRSASTAERNAEEDRKQRERAERKSQWWKRAQWALDLTLSEDTETRTVGFRMLDALAQSEWADAHEGDVIAAATERSLRQLSTRGRRSRRLGSRRRDG